MTDSGGGIKAIRHRNIIRYFTVSRLTAARGDETNITVQLRIIYWL